MWVGGCVRYKPLNLVLQRATALNTKLLFSSFFFRLFFYSLADLFGDFFSVTLITPHQYYKLYGHTFEQDPLRQLKIMNVEPL